MNYSPEAILYLARFIKGNEEARVWLQKNNLPELILLCFAIQGNDEAIIELTRKKHIVLTAFAHAILNGDAHASNWLAQNKKFEWAAVVQIVNKKDKVAEAWLAKHKLIHFMGLAKVIREKEEETQDDTVFGMIKKYIRARRKK